MIDSDYKIEIEVDISGHPASERLGDHIYVWLGYAWDDRAWQLVAINDAALKKPVGSFSEKTFPTIYDCIKRAIERSKSEILEKLEAEAIERGWLECEPDPAFEAWAGSRV